MLEGMNKFESIWMRVYKSVDRKYPIYTITYPFTQVLNPLEKSFCKFSTGRTNWFVLTRPSWSQAELARFKKMHWNPENPWCGVVVTPTHILQHPVIHPYGFICTEKGTIDLELFGAMKAEFWDPPTDGGPEPMC